MARTLVKILVSSLSRSLFSGKILIYTNRPEPLFKVDRKNVEVIHVEENRETRHTQENRGIFAEEARIRAQFDGLGNALGRMRVEERQWVVFIDAASVCLRNIDHLFPLDHSGPYANDAVDLLWTGGAGKGSVAPSHWAIRGKHALAFLQSWANFGGSEVDASHVGRWSRFIEQLPLRKLRIESGEVAILKIDEVDWRMVADAAIIAAPEWPIREKLLLIQSLYLGTFLGDDDGMIVSLLEP